MMMMTPERAERRCVYQRKEYQSHDGGNSSSRMIDAVLLLREVGAACEIGRHVEFPTAEKGAAGRACILVELKVSEQRDGKVYG